MNAWSVSYCIILVSDLINYDYFGNKWWSIHRYGVVGRIPVLQPGGPGLIPDGLRNFNFYPGTGCVSFVCVLSWQWLWHSAEHRLQGDLPSCICLILWSFVFCPVLSLAVALTFCWPQVSRKRTLVYLFSVLVLYVLSCVICGGGSDILLTTGFKEAYPCVSV